MSPKTNQMQIVLDTLQLNSQGWMCTVGCAVRTVLASTSVCCSGFVCNGLYVCFVFCFNLAPAAVASWLWAGGGGGGGQITVLSKQHKVHMNEKRG